MATETSTSATLATPPPLDDMDTSSVWLNDFRRFARRAGRDRDRASLRLPAPGGGDRALLRDRLPLDPAGAVAGDQRGPPRPHAVSAAGARSGERRRSGRLPSHLGGRGHPGLRRRPVRARSVRAGGAAGRGLRRQPRRGPGDGAGEGRALARPAGELRPACLRRLQFGVLYRRRLPLAAARDGDRAAPPSALSGQCGERRRPAGRQLPAQPDRRRGVEPGAGRRDLCRSLRGGPRRGPGDGPPGLLHLSGDRDRRRSQLERRPLQGAAREPCRLPHGDLRSAPRAWLGPLLALDLARRRPGAQRRQRPSGRRGERHDL